MADRREASPGGALTFQADQRITYSQPQLFTEDAPGLYSKSHPDLVNHFTRLIQQNRQRLGVQAHLFPPENIIRTALYIKSRVHDKERTNFFYPLLRAWDAIAFDRYDLTDAQSAADDLNRASYGGSQSIKLTDPQVAIIDALAKAVGIQRQNGQTNIPIPDRLRGQNYWQWRTSPEYAQECEQRIARARMRKEE